MAFLLGYGSAVEWLRLANDEQLSGQIYGLSPLSLEGSRHRLERHMKDLDNLTQPLQLVVSHPDNRRPSAIAACHAVSLPYEDYHGLRIKRGLYCSAPALAFLQMASILDEERLLMLGFELCGRYGFEATGRLTERQQHLTPQILMGRAQNTPKVRGRRKALVVASEVLAGAASPMEAALAIILCATPEKGGFGLPAPELNRPLPVEGKARNLWPLDTITPDMLWESARLVIECDSDTRDARRRDVLTELGYRVITVTAEHISHQPDLERIASIVAEQAGATLPHVDAEGMQRRLGLQGRIRGFATNPAELLGFSTQE